MADFDDTCFPIEHRQAQWTVAALHQWELDNDDPRCISSAEDVSLYHVLTRSEFVLTR